jgi:hypothetical protein
VIFYWRILQYNFNLGSYDRLQHVIILDLNLVHFYLDYSTLGNTQNLLVQIEFLMCIGPRKHHIYYTFGRCCTVIAWLMMSSPFQTVIC